MAGKIDSGWARFILAIVIALVAVGATAATLNGRIVRNETNIASMKDDIRETRRMVNDLWKERGHDERDRGYQASDGRSGSAGG